jgi:hypothetical protein
MVPSNWTDDALSHSGCLTQRLKKKKNQVGSYGQVTAGVQHSSFLIVSRFL